MIRIFSVIVALALYCINIGPAWCQCSFSAGTAVRPNDLGSQDQFPSAIAIDGNSAFLGTFNQPTATAKGAVYVATHNISWSITQKLMEPNGAAAGHQFGAAVAVQGFWAVVGAPGASAAYVFQLSGTTWTYVQKLSISPSELGDFFGASVAIAGDTIAIGAYGSNSYVGKVYIFRYNGSSWGQVPSQILTANDGQSLDFFGYSLALSNNSLIVGAYGDDEPSGTNFGSSYIFKFNGTQWAFQQKLQAPDGASGDNFGQAVAIDTNKLIIGASRDDDVGNNAGSAYIFALEGTQWNFKKKLIGSDTVAGDWFGTSVAIRGNTVLVGSPLWDDSTESLDHGAIYPFVLNGSIWQEQSKLRPTGIYDANFGTTLALTSDSAIGGAPLLDLNGRDSGTAFFYNVQCSVAPIISSSSPPTGFVDALEDRDANSGALLGIKNVSLTFSAPVISNGGGNVGAANFDVTCWKNGAQVDDLQTGAHPTLTQVTPTDAVANTYSLQLSQRICLGAWTKITAINLADASSNTPISPTTGNSIVLGNLPMDITQDGKVLGDDISRWLAIKDGGFTLPAPLTPLMLLDQKRNAVIAGEDITRGIQLINGIGTIRAWGGFDMGLRP